MKLYLLFFSIFAFSNASYCQIEILWSETYSGDSYAQVCDIIQTTDNSYVFSGYVIRHTDDDVPYCGNLVKFSEDGEIIWETFLAWDDYLVPTGAIATSDGGFAVTGVPVSMGPPFVMKTNSDGEIEWSWRFNVHFLYDILETEEGFIVVGDDEFSGLIMKLDDQGRSAGSTPVSVENQSVSITSVINSNDGGYVLLIETRDPEIIETLLIFTDSEGDSTDSWIYPGEENFLIKTIELLPDEGYLLTGSYQDERRFPVPMAVEIDFEGNVASEVVFNFEIGDDWSWRLGSIIRTQDRGFALGGWTSYSGESDFLFVKTNVNGEIIWQGRYGIEERQGISCLQQNREGDYIVAGVAKDIDEQGESWLIVKAGQDPSNISYPSDSIIPHPSSFILSNPYPNPFNSTTTIEYTLPFASDITLNLYNLTGQRVETLVSGRMQAGINRIMLNADDLVSGLYFLRLQSPKMRKNYAGDQVQKLMLLK